MTSREHRARHYNSYRKSLEAGERELKNSEEDTVTGQEKVEQRSVVMAAFMFILFIGTVFISCLILIGHLLILELRKRRVTKEGGLTVGIFHPYCNAGGGGEKVLWCAIRALQLQHPQADIVVYTGDTDARPEQIVSRASERLNAKLPRPVRFVFLRCRRLVEARYYPVCTLLGQSLGSVLLGAEAMWRYLPDVYIDTMGYAFTMPLFSWLGGCRVGCYVHYPTVTPDMLRRVQMRVEAHNNRAAVARSPILTAAKLVYYRAFAWLYRMAGGSADVVMVNSSWTKNHVIDLWQRPQSTHLVYPPCDVQPLLELSRKASDDVEILSLGQFRPEKDHPLQIKAFQIVKSKVSAEVWSKVRLVVVGSCRDEEDGARARALTRLCEELGVARNVRLKVNLSYEELLKQFTTATAGLHTMWNEHFGIGIVECMAAGLVIIAHRSGGPKMDIVDESEVSRTGYLAETAEEYADAILEIINAPADKLDAIRKAARSSVDRFSVNNFEQSFLKAVSKIMDSKKTK